MTQLNLGILAHVDAGKTTLTERLLYAAGVIDAIGSVDQGTTQTDSLALERQRGITIRAAVVAFRVDGVTVNLIDTPGHPDFIAEVDRTLAVLDGAVLVVSAVEGVQPQTVVLMRALRRLRVPTLIFVNKIDRSGADPDRVLVRIRERLTSDAVVMGATRDEGSRAASFVPYEGDEPGFVDALVDRLVEHDEDLLSAIVDGRAGAASPAHLRCRLATQTAAARVQPVFFGSAITGAGIPCLMAALTSLLPTAGGDPEAPVAGSVFKVERGPAGERLSYVRMRAGTLRLRERLQLGSGRAETVTGIRVFEHGGAVDRACVAAGQIAQLSGLREVRVGDRFGSSVDHQVGSVFAPPGLETAVVARDPSQKALLHAALSQLAEQDPLINLRQDDRRQELFVSLYGEVQKEVIEHTLSVEFGVAIDFRETTTLCIERVVGTGRAVEQLGDPSNPFVATVGLQIEPGELDSGLQFRLGVDVGALPLYVYKNVEAFCQAMTDHLRTTLQQGLSGWRVNDCLVTLTDCGYQSPSTTAADYRRLTPLVTMAALAQAGTVVCEPIHRFRIDAPADTLSAVLRLLAQHRAVPQAPSLAAGWCAVTGDIPAAEVHRLQQQLHGRTHGEGVLEVAFDRYEPGFGPAPVRPRFDHNPLNRKEYLLHVLRRI
ncbi:TetM/TetW/TetO/TetS family tetracycline resistance ribosomal protection protein [Microlunatus panaciterrae]|uniref:Ribosomal protection tetracycline resistance protein n=1 Tax=Microlunatus panaciterrae TaxID=400768 RepID=A0ABS2RII5_9ACTN|nr:TetM/TetW/TetO/TetS family tetracycline resistance ribosomal protection protein [Microlunatus panaciterrae]MBM7798804.1 ribosomal protection tetracycline resistance protein [Microlunatus panaciterrae]